jgi:hypothetical protein
LPALAVNIKIVYPWDVAYMPTLETKSGREGSTPPENVFSEGCKMVHSVAFWIYNLFSQLFKYKCSMKNP